VKATMAAAGTIAAAACPEARATAKPSQPIHARMPRIQFSRMKLPGRPPCEKRTQRRKVRRN
jgi:hypothetical protein